MAGLELLGDGVGVVGKGEKIRSNLSRKFASLGNITLAGGGGSLAGFTSTGLTPSGDAQPQIASESISDVAIALRLERGLIFLMGFSNGRKLLGVLPLDGAVLFLELANARGRSLCILRALGFVLRTDAVRAIVPLPIAHTGQTGQPCQNDAKDDPGIGHCQRRPVCM